MRPVRYGKRVMDPLTGLRSDAAIEPAEPREAGEWLRSHGVFLAAVTLIAIQLLWMGDLLAHSYFRTSARMTSAIFTVALSPGSAGNT